ncbi:sugar ABC transporter permease, partial [Rhizobium brockwellii]
MTRNDPIKHFFIWPALLIVLVISIFPLIYSLTTSFMSLRLVPPIPARFVCFGNYTELLQNPRFWRSASISSIFGIAGAVPR